MSGMTELPGVPDAILTPKLRRQLVHKVVETWGDVGR